MIPVLPKTCRCRILASVLWVMALAGIVVSTSAADPKRVLIIDPYGPGVAPFSVVLSEFRTTLGREYGEGLEFYEVSLDRARFREPEADEPFVDFLRSRMGARPVDLVATVGGPGMDFVVRHQAGLFPAAPVVFIAGSPEVAPVDRLQPRATQVTTTLYLAGLVEGMLEVLPQTANIVVIAGASPLEILTAEQCRRAFQPFTNRVSFTWLTGLSLDRTVAACTNLPPRTCILHTMYLVDAAGTPFEGNQPLSRLHAAANAPIFGYFESDLGMGIVGGRLYPDLELGAEAARTAVRILQGEDPRSIPTRLIQATTPMFDARELRRWGIREGALPPGSSLQFRQPDFWDLYRWPIAGVVTFLLVQGALILGLLVNRARRREGETAATLIAEISSKFVNLPPGDVEREIMDAQRRICGVLGLDLAGLWQWSDDTPAGLRLTHLFRTDEGPEPPEPMLAREYFPWLETQMRAGRTIAVSSLRELPEAASRDRETFRHFTTKANLTIPLAVGGESLLGALGFNTTRSERRWPRVLVSRLGLLAQIFANALARRRADELIRTDEARLRAGTELAGLGHYEVDYGTGRCFVDSRFQSICGMPPDACEGRRALGFWQEHVHPEDLQCLLDERQELHVGRKASISMEYRYRHPSQGERTIHHLAALATHRPSGSGVRTFGVIRDITCEKQFQREADELRGNLAHLTRVNALGALSASLAHELNQPLGIILSNAQAAQELMVQDPPNLAEVREILSDIVAADRRAGEVIQRLRALLKRGEISLHPLALNEVIDEVLQLTQADLIARGVTVQRSFATDLPKIAGDRVQLQQLILNLVLNAAESMAGHPPGSRQIHLRTSFSESAVLVSVRDQGTGLPTDVDRLFQPFYTTKSQGLGMGLAICRSIVTAHHGRIWAEPNPEAGSVFHVELPAASDSSAP